MRPVGPQRSPDVRLINHLHISPRLGMRGAISQSTYVFMAYCLIKHTNGVNFVVFEVLTTVIMNNAFF
jgi:hypothetical protein